LVQHFTAVPAGEVTDHLVRPGPANSGSGSPDAIATGTATPADAADGLAT
jgi:hypothetical protein